MHSIYESIIVLVTGGEVSECVANKMREGTKVELLLLIRSPNQDQHDNNQSMLHYIGYDKNCEGFALLG